MNNKNCGTCFFRRVSVYGPLYDTVKLSCKFGYKLNTLLQPAIDNCWKEWKLKKTEKLK